MIRLTVLMPVFNNGPHLKEALDSVLNQTYSQFKLLAVYDKSSDNSLDILKSYKDKRIEVLEKPEKNGLWSALQYGMEKIETEYVVRMDADDISDKTRFEKLITFLDNNPDIGVCSCFVKTFGTAEQIWEQPVNDLEIKAGLLFNSTILHAGSMFRRNIFNNKNVEYTGDYSCMEDYDLWFKMIPYTKFHNLNEILYLYRREDHNMTVQNKSSLSDRYKLFYKRTFKLLGLDANDKNLSLHEELANNLSKKSFKVAEDKSWIDLLLVKVKKSELFDYDSVKKICDKKWDNLFYKIVEDKQSVKQYFKLTETVNPVHKKYLFKYKLNKLIGRAK